MALLALLSWARPAPAAERGAPARDRGSAGRDDRAALLFLSFLVPLPIPLALVVPPSANEASVPPRAEARRPAPRTGHSLARSDGRRP